MKLFKRNRSNFKTLAFLKYCKYGASDGSNINNAFPLAVAPLQVLPTRWIYSFVSIN